MADVRDGMPYRVGTVRCVYDDGHGGMRVEWDEGGVSVMYPDEVKVLA